MLEGKQIIGYRTTNYFQMSLNIGGISINVVYPVVESFAMKISLSEGWSVLWVKWEILPWMDKDEIGGIIMFTEVINERKNK